MNSLVSIIIPMYKVEEYIAQCIESVLLQTYEHLEIIIVNDGSPDRSREIAAAYQDDRIILIDQENGGLSDARNTGMRFVNGEYTMFLDSDDWLVPTCVETLIKLAIKEKADAVQSSFYYAFEKELLVDKRLPDAEKLPVVLHNRELMEKLVENIYVKNFAWGKIYKTQVIQDIPFRKGVLFEDMFWAHLVMSKVNIYVVNSEPLLYYRQRAESIVGSYSLKHLDIIKGMKERLAFINNNYEELTAKARKQLVKLQLEHYRLLITFQPYRLQKIERKKIEKDLKEEKLEIFKAVENDKDLKKKLKLFYIHPSLYATQLIINKITRKMKKTLPEGPLIKVQKEEVSS